VHAEEEYRRFFRNAGTHLPSYTVSQWLSSRNLKQK
jgi:hypothetical protein